MLRVQRSGACTFLEHSIDMVGCGKGVGLCRAPRTEGTRVNGSTCVSTTPVKCSGFQRIHCLYTDAA